MCVRGSRGRPRAVLNLHLCVRRSGVLGVEMKTLPVNERAGSLFAEDRASSPPYISMCGIVAVLCEEGTLAVPYLY